MPTIFKYIIPFYIFLAFNVTSIAQTKTGEINAIKEEFKAINNDTTLKKVPLNPAAFLENVPDGGWELTGYYKAGQIKKIYYWIGLSNGIELMEFYFKKSQLIFVYEKFNSYKYDKKKGQLDFTKTETTFEGRYYFKNQNLIDYITTGHNRFEDDAIDPAKTLPAEANENLKLLDKRKAEINDKN